MNSSQYRDVSSCSYGAQTARDLRTPSRATRTQLSRERQRSILRRAPSLNASPGSTMLQRRRSFGEASSHRTGRALPPNPGFITALRSEPSRRSWATREKMRAMTSTPLGGNYARAINEATTLWSNRARAGFGAYLATRERESPSGIPRGEGGNHARRGKKQKHAG